MQDKHIDVIALMNEYIDFVNNVICRETGRERKYFLALLLVSSKDFKLLYFIPSPLVIFPASNIKNAKTLDIQLTGSYNIAVIYSTAIFLGRCVP